jgi:small GTP-binding protein
MRANLTEDGTLSFKFILIGCAGVGKTALLKRLIDGTFSDSSDPTVGVEFETAFLQIDDQRVQLQIWDTAGQEKFRSITKAYYRTAAGVLIVFDVTDRRSFDQLPSWIGDARSLCDPTAVISLIGTKCDWGDDRVINMLEAESFAQEYHMTYIETSAKSGDNVRNAFLRTVAALQERGEGSPRDPGGRSPLMKSLTGSGGQTAASGCC